MTFLEYLQQQKSQDKSLELMVTENTLYDLLKKIKESCSLTNDKISRLLKEAKDYCFKFLHIAAALNDTASINYLLNQRINVDDFEAHLYTPLHIAVSYGSLEAVKLLIEKNADVNKIASYHGSGFVSRHHSLHLAVLNATNPKALDILLFLLEQKVFTDIRTYSPQERLYLRHAQVPEIANFGRFENSVDVCEQNCYYSWCISNIFKHPQIKTYKTFRYHFPERKVWGLENSWNFLELAHRMYPDFLKKLIPHLDYTKHGLSALHVAAEFNYADLLEELLTQEKIWKNIELLDCEDTKVAKTALDIAAEKGHRENAVILLRHRAIAKPETAQQLGSLAVHVVQIVQDVLQLDYRQLVEQQQAVEKNRQCIAEQQNMIEMQQAQLDMQSSALQSLEGFYLQFIQWLQTSSNSFETPTVSSLGQPASPPLLTDNNALPSSGVSSATFPRRFFSLAVLSPSLSSTTISSSPHSNSQNASLTQYELLLQRISQLENELGEMRSELQAFKQNRPYVP